MSLVTQVTLEHINTTCHSWCALAIYFEQTDHTGHKNGPFSSELNEVIRSLDQVMSDLVDCLSDPGLSDVNLLIFSDHGMTEVFAC